MKEKLAGYRKIGFKALTNWIKTGGTGILFSLVCLIISSIMLLKSGSDDAGISKLNAFSDRPLVSILFVSSFIFPIVYVALANQYALKTLLYQVWRNKLVDFVIPKVDSYVSKLSNLQPNWFRNVTTAAAVKAQLLDVLRKDKSVNKIQRIVLNYGFNKLKINNTDFQQPENVFTSILIERVRNLLNFSSEPSAMLFWFVAGIQLLALIIVIVLG